jgi:hypothetical protein
MNPTNKPLSVVLGGKTYPLYFDLNTFEAFERQTGVFFLDFLASLGESIQSLQAQVEGAADSSKDALRQVRVLDVMRRLSLTNIRALIWAALHTYDKSGEPVWPFTIGQMSRLIDVETMATLFPRLMTASMDNIRGSSTDGGDSSTNEEGAALRPTLPETSTPLDGGNESGPSDADVLGSLTLKSDG